MVRQTNILTDRQKINNMFRRTNRQTNIQTDKQTILYEINNVHNTHKKTDNLKTEILLIEKIFFIY